MITLDTKVSDLTVGELLTFLSQREQKRQITSMAELAEYLGCSLATAHRIKASGRIDKAIRQVGRTFRIDTAELDRLLSR